jgi:hypothetical protein
MTPSRSTLLREGFFVVLNTCSAPQHMPCSSTHALLRNWARRTIAALARIADYCRLLPIVAWTISRNLWTDSGFHLQSISDVLLFGCRLTVVQREQRIDDVWCRF